MSSYNVMLMTSISAGFVTKDKKLLMIQNQDGEWEVPSCTGKSGELSSDTAERAVKEFAKTDCEVDRYKKNLKTTCEENGEELNWQPYTVEISSEPENGEWIPINDLENRELSQPLEENLSNLNNRL